MTKWAYQAKMRFNPAPSTKLEKLFSPRKLVKKIILYELSINFLSKLSINKSALREMFQMHLGVILNS